MPIEDRPSVVAVRARVGSLGVAACLAVVMTATAGMSAAFQVGSGDDAPDTARVATARAVEAPAPPGQPAAPPPGSPGAPAPAPTVGDEAPANPDRTAVLPQTHAVQAGETLSGVAERYDVTVAELAHVNAAGDDVIRPGEQLVVPADDTRSFAVPEDVAQAGVALEGLLTEAAAEYGLDPALVQAVAWRESRWQQRVVSHRGAIGVLQVRPQTAAAVGDEIGRDLDLHDVEDNVVAGAAYFAELLDRYRGDVASALAAYHQGPTALAERGRIPVTERYVRDVLALRDTFAAH